MEWFAFAKEPRSGGRAAFPLTAKSIANRQEREPPHRVPFRNREVHNPA